LKQAIEIWVSFRNVLKDESYFSVTVKGCRNFPKNSHVNLMNSFAAKVQVDNKAKVKDSAGLNFIQNTNQTILEFLQGAR
jgi:hypothetical protein